MNSVFAVRRLLLSDSSISLLLHSVKSVLALAMNWIVLAQFAPADYVTWAVSSSILLVATASDLGIGQYAATQFIHAPPDRWPAIARNAMAALVPLAVGAVVFVYLALGSQPAAYKAAMASFIGLRVLSIPFGAALNAVNQFKLRKGIEVGVYATATVLIGWVAHTNTQVLWALLILNAGFMLGGFVTMHFALKYLRASKLWVPPPRICSLGAVYRASVPFMVNNLTGLLTYGGFIWISSFLIPTDALAKLAVLHTFVLINAYQVYDVALRARQADLIRAEHVKRMSVLNVALMLCCPAVAFLFGETLLSLITQTMEFTQSEILLFSAFIAVELGFLLIQSVVQVSPRLAPLLTRYSLVKLSCQAMSVAIFWLVASDTTETLSNYIALLTATSFVGYLSCGIHLRAHLRPTEG